MKKIAILGLAALMIVAFCVPASALESIFGGYWRTRAFSQRDFTGGDDPVTAGNNTEDDNLTAVDTRARLYYTAVLNDNLKFVNRLEIDAVWGQDRVGGNRIIAGTNADGDIDTDGVGVEVKHSYVDFNVGGFVNGKVGLQPGFLGRGFLFDADFAGVTLSFYGENFSIPFIWMRAYEDGKGSGKDEVDYFAVAPTFGNETFSFTPFGMYAYSNNASNWGRDDKDPEDGSSLYDPKNNKYPKTSEFDSLNMWYAGANIDANMGAASIWLTGIYQGGNADLAGSDPVQSVDFKAWLAAAGLSIDMGGVADLHGQAFYATGDDDNDTDRESFFVPAGQSYYWAEIMGLGVFDNQASRNACADQIGNVMAGNLGTTIKPSDDLSISLDAWYAKLAESINITDTTTGQVSEEDELGIEANVKISYQLVEGLQLDLIGAYLFAGDATTAKYNDTTGRYEKISEDKNPYEIGTQLSLSF